MKIPALVEDDIQDFRYIEPKEAKLLYGKDGRHGVLYIETRKD